MVNLTALLDFWKRKKPPVASAVQTLVPIPGPGLDTPRSTTQEVANRAREALKLLKLERQILGSAVTTIYESQNKGLISQAERDQLMDKYKVEIKRLEKAIYENQRVVDLYDLEAGREELIKNFRSRLADLDVEIKNLKTGGSLATRNVGEEKPQKAEGAEDNKSEGSEEAGRSAQQQGGKEKKAESEEEQQINDAEKRIEKIREEILKAMDRLEQIEAEG